VCLIIVYFVTNQSGNIWLHPRILKIQVEVFWIVKSYSVVVRYQRFGGPCYLHLDFTSP